MQAQEGNQTAFEGLYNRYNTPMCIYMARMVGNDEVGCELVQETFLKVWQGLPSLRDPHCFTSWLYRIATNVVRDYQRRVRRLPLLPWNEYTKSADDISVEGPEQQIEETEIFNLALARVSLTYRACLVMYIVEELPQQQIAERLSINKNSVSKYVSRGLEEFRQIYFRLVNEYDVFREGRRN
jgi:RNA polymerase sigma-70 factor (ECF subfamily)